MDNLRRRFGKAKNPFVMVGDYEAVDLGLPSGVLWATRNVGANDETEVGNYYQWGSGSAVYIYPGTNYHHVPIENYRYGYSGHYTLPSSADTATQVMGEGWKTPTGNETGELKDNITLSETFTNNSGVVCGKFVSKINPDAYIIIPFGGVIADGSTSLQNINGMFWVNTARYANGSNDDQSNYWQLGVNGNYSNHWMLCERGLNVRAVHDPI